jgi:hypothetical protein
VYACLHSPSSRGPNSPHIYPSIVWQLYIPVATIVFRQALATAAVRVSSGTFMITFQLAAMWVCMYVCEQGLCKRRNSNHYHQILLMLYFILFYRQVYLYPMTDMNQQTTKLHRKKKKKITSIAGNECIKSCFYGQYLNKIITVIFFYQFDPRIM